MGSGHTGGGDSGGVGIGVEHRVSNGRGTYVDLVEDEEVGGVRGFGSLVFWTFMSLAAVVMSSWGGSPNPAQFPLQAWPTAANVYPQPAPPIAVPPNAGVVMPSSTQAHPAAVQPAVTGPVYPHGTVLPPPEVAGAVAPKTGGPQVGHPLIAVQKKP